MNQLEPLSLSIFEENSTVLSKGAILKNVPVLPLLDAFTIHEQAYHSIRLNFFKNLYKLVFTVGQITIKNQKLFNIYLLDLMGSYRGWRHMQGLPVRGQRTWSNGWCSYRSNVELRNLYLELANVYYTKFKYSLKEQQLTLLAENINKLWASQWESEWKKAKKQQKKAIRSNYRYFRVDLGRLAQGNVNSKKERKNRKKQAEERKNHFLLGFDPGFSKLLLENNAVSTERLGNSKEKITKSTEIQFQREAQRAVKKKLTKKIVGIKVKENSTKNNNLSQTISSKKLWF